MKRKMKKNFKQKIENDVGEKKNEKHLYTIQIRYIIFIHLETCTSLFFFLVDHIIIIDNIYNNNLNSHILLYSYRS